ncbi:FGFR1 oncoprotein partner [Rhizoclosmatium hyalinum]|nr:FGFR1 oncoprotein partner [Rhizoclosmatium hyalinum]
MGSELKTLVADVLQKNGTLGKIKAELRASVFNVLQNVDKRASTPKSAPQFKTKEESTAIALVKEFLEYYNLDYTLSVLEPEANQSKADSTTAIALARELNLDESKKRPLLMQLLEQRQDSSDKFRGLEATKDIGTMPMHQHLKHLEATGFNELDEVSAVSDFNTSERTISRSTSAGGLDIIESL